MAIAILFAVVVVFSLSLLTPAPGRHLLWSVGVVGLGGLIQHVLRTGRAHAPWESAYQQAALRFRESGFTPEAAHRQAITVICGLHARQQRVIRSKRLDAELDLEIGRHLVFPDHPGEDVRRQHLRRALDRGVLNFLTPEQQALLLDRSGSGTRDGDGSSTPGAPLRLVTSAPDDPRGSGATARLRSRLRRGPTPRATEHDEPEALSWTVVRDRSIARARNTHKRSRDQAHDLGLRVIVSLASRYPRGLPADGWEQIADQSLDALVAERSPAPRPEQGHSETPG
ncbi:MAG TPA: hypothetical protein VEW93_12040 [Acidimicrobiales bacterium]|nr:hypothetical protein [Acidimicrobiales bacterium]